MRLFIAILLPEVVRETIELLLGAVRGERGVIRWIPPKDVHLTLKFLGEVNPPIVQDVESLLNDIVRPRPTFELTVRGSGVFPSPRQPRIIWLGLGTHPVLLQIHQEIEEGLGPLGFAPEKREFRPHLTIGRVKSNRRLGSRDREWLMELLKGLDCDAQLFRVASVELMESILSPTGAEYHVRASFSLEG